MKWKRRIAAILIAIITVTGTVGCSRITKDTKNDATTDTNAVKDVDHKEVAMGRYVEEAVKMPEAVISGEEIAYILMKNPEHQLEIYCATRSMSGTMSYTLQPDNSWKKTVPEWLQLKGMMILAVAYAADGMGYAVAGEYGEDKVTIHIIKSADAKTYEEITPEEFEEAVDYAKVPTDLNILPDGRLMLSFYDQFTIYKDGREDTVIPSGGYQYAMSTDGKQVMHVNEKADGIAITDTDTGKTISEIPYQGDISSIAFTSDGNGNWYILNNMGISRIIKNGSVLETIVDGALSSMSMPSYSMDAILTGEEEDFYTMYQYGEGERDIKHYVYDENMPSTPEETLTVISLGENATIRQAITEFQKKNSNVKIDYRVTNSEVSGIAVTDQIKTINTELLAGKGADLYILDGMPTDSYIEKGALADISDLIKPLKEKGELLSNVIDCYQEKEAIYLAPIRFYLPFAFGERNAVVNTSTIKSLAEYTGKQAKTPLFGENVKSYSQIVKKLYMLYSGGFIGEDKKLDREGLLQFLESLNTICTQSKAVDDADAVKTDQENDPIVEAMIYYEGASELGFAYVATETDIYAPFSAIDSKKGSYSCINSSFLPVGLIGVNNASSQKELAYEFIREIYSEEVQSADVGQGMPVNVKALEGFGMKANDYYISGPNNFEAVQPAKEKRQELIALAKTLKNPIEQDTVLLDMILDDILPYLKGQADAASTADKIMNKASTYYAE